MKKLILAAGLILLMAGAAVADEGLEQYIELFRSDLKTQTVAVITEVMDFSEAEGNAFWPIYREMEVDRAKLVDERIALIKDYAANYASMTDAKAKELINRAFKLEESRLKLHQKYYKKIESATSSITAAKFMQLMNQIDLLIDISIASEMPLVERPQM